MVRGRGRRAKTEYDETGKELSARVSTTIRASNYNWAVAHGLQFGALLDRAIGHARRIQWEAEHPTRTGAELERIARLREFIADRNRKGEPVAEDELRAKRLELGFPI